LYFSRKEEALAAYQKAIDLGLKEAYAHNGLGVVYADLGRNEEAIAAFRKAIEFDPKLAGTYSNLGYLYLTQNNLQEALKNFEKAIALDDPEDYVAPINLGITCFRLGNNEQAKSYFQSALVKCPTSSVHGLLNKVAALLGLEQKENALILLRQTCENFKIAAAEKNAFLTDWNFLASSPAPLASIKEFLKETEILLA
jgi:tetratricopeptide (TPR) repeat protein